MSEAAARSAYETFTDGGGEPWDEVDEETKMLWRDVALVAAAQARIEIAIKDAPPHEPGRLRCFLIKARMSPTAWRQMIQVIRKSNRNDEAIYVMLEESDTFDIANVDRSLAEKIEAIEARSRSRP